MVTTSIKKIHDCNYLYYHYYQDGKKKDKYCGPAAKPESKQRALEFELEYLEKQHQYYAVQIKQTREKLLKLKNIKQNKN